MRSGLALICIFILASADLSARPKRVRRPRDPIPAALLGSETSLAVENEVVDAAGLARIADRDELVRRIADRTLVPVEPSRSVTFDKDLGALDRENRSLYMYALPWTAAFVADLGKEMRRRFGRPLTVSSLVRHEAYQRELVKINSSAATGATPETRSSHLTGMTVDISTEHMPRAIRLWLRQRLQKLERAEKVQATEERHTQCFHVMVFPGYDGIWPERPRPPIPSEHKCTLR